MSRNNSPGKHKGLKTSLYRKDQKQQTQRLQSNRYPAQNNPSRVFVQTIAQQPNVLPYINSDYSSSQPQKVNPAHSQYVIGVGRQNNLISGTRPQVITTNMRVSPVISNQDLSRTKIEGHYQSRVPQINNGSTYIPPPPQSFLIANSASTKVIQTRQMGRSVIHSVPVTTILPTQSVKKTFIPHHIINQIPVYTGTVYSEQVAQQQEPVNNDQSQQVLMGYYQKLYTKYQSQKQRSSHLSQQLNQAISEINYWKSQAQSQPKMEMNILPPRGRVIDKRRLHDLLMSKCSSVIDQIVENRKLNCLHQVTSVIESRRVSVKLPVQVSQQQQKVEFMHSQR